MNKKENYKWNLDLISTSEEEFDKEKKEIKNRVDSFANKWNDRDDYLTNSKALKEALDDYESLMADYGTSGDQGYYYFLKKSLDQSNSELKAKAKKVEEFSKRQENKLRFFELNLAKIKKANQKKFLESDLLSDYRNYLRQIFRESDYLLSEKEERIMSLKSSPAYNNWVEMVSDFLSRETREVLTKKGEKEKKSFSEITSLIRDEDKKIRDKAAEAFNDILAENVDVAEVELNSVLEDKKINDLIRGFDRPDQSRFIGDDLEAETVDKLVEAVTDNFDIAQDYYKLKAKLFGVEKLDYHERTVPLKTIDKEYSFEETCEIIKKVLRGLDPEFESIFNQFVEEGHVDAFPKKGKSGGAFCVHNLIHQPVYILLNHTKKLEDVITFIHETGHGINNEMMRKKQNALNFGISTFTAEVASTFFEDFVTEKVIEEASDDLKLAMTMNKLDRDISTIFRQIAAINFERSLHQEFRKKGRLSKEEIGNLFKEHMEAYMGDYVEQSEGSENWWVYWSHLRRFFYNYSYAGGLLISKNLQRKTRKDSQFINKVKKFLETGTSKSPKEIFNEMGIDIQDKGFWSSGIKEVKDLLGEAKKLSNK
ncbi:MAG: M3 family oligoendopeptidase [Patescibacteria group bacterium]